MNIDDRSVSGVYYWFLADKKFASKDSLLNHWVIFNHYSQEVLCPVNIYKKLKYMIYQKHCCLGAWLIETKENV